MGNPAQQVRALQAKGNGSICRLSFHDAIKRAGLDILASNKTMDRVLPHAEELGLPSALFPCWTGTFIAHEKPGKKLGHWIVHHDNNGVCYAFPAGSAMGEKDVVLVAEHCDGYTLQQDGHSWFVLDAKKVDVLESFPESSGWYVAEPSHGIPIGSQVASENPKARYLYRNDSMVGPIARSLNSFFNNKDDNRKVYAYLSLLSAFGVVLEETAESAARREVGKELSALGKELSIARNSPSELAVNGTKEQIDALLQHLGRNI